MTVHEHTDSPSMAALYGKVAATAPLPRRGDALPDAEAVRPDVTTDVDHLAAYTDVCGLRLRDELPLTYLSVVAFPLTLSLMARRDFPFTPLGLVHIATRIEQTRPVTIADRPTLRVRTADLRPHRKGRQFDVVATAEVDGEVVWRDVSTHLRRGGGTGEDDGDRTAKGPTPTRTATWRVPGDMGRRYAAVTGDRNPIHLWPLTARAFGFPRAIVHGMWTAARCLGALESRLPDEATFDVAFKRPLLLPSTVEFRTAEDDAGWVFGVHARDGAPHLTGRAGG